MDYWPDDPVPLPRPPLISITEVRTLDEDNVASVYSADNYYIIPDSTIGELIIKHGSTPPTNNSNRTRAGYEIEYITGYGLKPSTIPQTILEGLKLWATALYEERVTSMEPPPEAVKLLDTYKVHRV